MGEQIKNDAWLLGYNWAMGNVYIGENSIHCTHLQIMPEFDQGVQAAEEELKKDELKKLVLKDS